MSGVSPDASVMLPQLYGGGDGGGLGGEAAHAVLRNALNKYSSANAPKAGSLLHYFTPGKNDNHVEWLLSDMDDQGCAEHGGGGRTDNAITVGSGDVTVNYGRPLQEWLDPDMLLP